MEGAEIVVDKYRVRLAMIVTSMTNRALYSN